MSIAAIVFALLAGGGVPIGASRLTFTLRNARSHHWRIAQLNPDSIPEGAQEAGRWLRDHSDPDDLIATNAHCQIPGGNPCENGHVWVSGYTERRILIEGWGYTNAVHVKALETGVIEGQIPYWHPEILRDNDAAFLDPSQETISRLRDYYGVRWLFVDERHSIPPPKLENFATLRFRLKSCVIYQIN